MINIGGLGNPINVGAELFLLMNHLGLKCNMVIFPPIFFLLKMQK